MSRTHNAILRRLALFGGRRKPWRQWPGGKRPPPRRVPMPWPALFVLVLIGIMLLLSCKT